MFRIFATTSFAVLTVGLVLNSIAENSVIHSARAQPSEESNTERDATLTPPRPPGYMDEMDGFRIMRDQEEGRAQ